MAAYQEFQKDNIVIRYFGESKVLYLIPTRQASKEKLGLLKKQLETFLSIDSIKMQESGKISLKLSDSSASNVPEMLRAIGASGGEAIEDAASVAEEPAEEEAREAEAETGQPAGAPPGGQPGAPMPPEQEGSQMQLAAHLMPKIFTMMYESTFELDSSLNKPRKPGRRTGKYWKPIETVTGKNRIKINEKDVLNVRRKYSKKPDNEDRNKVLRALDKAFNYFFGKLEETSKRHAEKYAEDYYAIDDLNPKDYSLDRGAPEPIGEEEEESMALEPSNDLNGIDFVDFADLLNSDEDSYDDVEIEEETF